MTTDEKMLLIEDLCCRLPFGVKCYIPEINDYRVLGSIQYDGINTLFDFWNKEQTRYELQLYISEFKPCLIPTSSMSIRQRDSYNWLSRSVSESVFKKTPSLVNFFYKHHIDCNRFINNDLAIDATELNIY
jgi:hypothetical protein